MEAIAADGKLFAALDADLMVVPAGDQTTTSLAPAGAYRPQPGPAGAALDRAIVRRFAAAATRSFVARVSCALVPPRARQGLQAAAPRRSLGDDKP